MDAEPELRAITVRQPWAWAIEIGAKLVENRSRLTPYRGPLAIHAGQQFSARGKYDRRVWAEVNRWREAHPDPMLPGSLPWERTGVIVAVANLVDAHSDESCCRPWGESSYDEAVGGRRLAVAHLVLEDVRALPEPVPCRGMLGLWRPPPEVRDEVAVQLVRAERKAQRGT